MECYLGLNFHAIASIDFFKTCIVVTGTLLVLVRIGTQHHYDKFLLSRQNLNKQSHLQHAHI